jgi:hypothetical protein
MTVCSREPMSPLVSWMPLQGTTWVLRRAIAEWASLARRAELAMQRGKGTLPVSCLGGRSACEPGKAGVCSPAADAANAAESAMSSLVASCILERSADNVGATDGATCQHQAWPDTGKVPVVQCFSTAKSQRRFPCSWGLAISYQLQFTSQSRPQIQGSMAPSVSGLSSQLGLERRQSSKSESSPSFLCPISSGEGFRRRRVHRRLQRGGAAQRGDGQSLRPGLHSRHLVLLRRHGNNGILILRPPKPIAQWSN